MTLTCLLFLLVFSLSVGQAALDRTIPVVNDIELWQQVGQQPYEFTWTQRQEDPHTLIDFEDLRGWNLDLYDGAKGELRRSREQQLWGQHVAKFLYSGTSDASRVVARPPKPIPIPGAFDSIDLWGYGNRWSWVEDKTTPAAEIAVWLTDARGKEFRVELTSVQWKQWWLIHRKVPASVLNQIALPASISGIEIAKAKNTELRPFFCDSLAVYKEDLNPLNLKPQPRRNLKPWRGQIAGVNTGEGTLPFPTREETILPTNFERDFKVTVRELSPTQFELRYQARDATVIYTYRPRSGSLAEIDASVNGGRAFRPMQDGGVRFTDTPEGRVAEGQLISAAVSANGVRSKFQLGSRIVEYELRLWQKSLVVDALCEGGEAVELRFGHAAGLTDPRLITIPYLTYARSNPRVLLAANGAKPLFASVWFDWYRSNASEAYAATAPKLTPDTAELNGGMRYLAKTDGSRNTLFERIFVTASPVYEEVLPTIDNPPSLRQQEGREVLWTVTEPQSFPDDHRRSQAIRAYGIDKIMQHSHEVTWRDEGDSNTMKLNASPLKGGDAMLQWYIRVQNGLGWLQGVYSNYTDFCTVNTNWNPDHVIRGPDGEWRRAWPRNYRLKPAKAVEFDEYYAKRIKEKFGVKMSYTDVHTAIAPWDNTDYDARVPGAGTFAATFYAYGQVLLNDQHVYGPTQSEATYQWLYAGLDSGDYGWVYTKVNLLTHPLDVAFMLHKIHPLEASYGMGYTFYYLEQIDKKWRDSPKRRDYVDLFLSTSIAYGNMGWLVNEFDQSTEFGVEAMTRSYYMMQQLQQQYAFVRPRKIEFASPDVPGKWYTASEAHANRAIEDSRLHVSYENGTEVYVNRGQSGNWTVKDHRGQSVDLPASGWLVYNPSNGFYELSANIAGRRIDHVASTGYEFLDGRGQWTEYGNLGATGSVVMRQKGTGVSELIDLYGNNRIGFKAPAGGTLTAYDPDGDNLGKVPTQSPNPGWQQFQPVPKGRTYVYAN
ncbi:MAG: hypothetical protein IT168_21705 [Bryobacterales bacterium]|nr:hypothetical protein [Bryobacterales bacterium]